MLNAGSTSAHEGNQQLLLFTRDERAPQTTTLTWIECGHCHGALSPWGLACDRRCTV